MYERTRAKSYRTQGRVFVRWKTAEMTEANRKSRVERAVTKIIWSTESKRSLLRNGPFVMKRGRSPSGEHIAIDGPH